MKVLLNALAKLGVAVLGVILLAVMAVLFPVFWILQFPAALPWMICRGFVVFSRTFFRSVRAGFAASKEEKRLAKFFAARITSERIQ